MNHLGMDALPDFEIPPVEYQEVVLPNDSIARQRITDVLSRSVNGEVAAGDRWYDEASEYCKELGKEKELTLPQAAAVVALLSPMKSWIENKKIAERVIRLDDFRGVLPYSDDRIKSIFTGGDPRERTLGARTAARKVFSFFDNMAYPKTSNSVTIDRHMWTLLLPDTPLRILRAKYTVDEYEWAEARFREVAAEQGKRPHQIQAATWIIWRRVNHASGGNYHPQGTQEFFDLSEIAISHS